MNYLYEYNTPLGLITVVSGGTHITGLWLEGQHRSEKIIGANPLKEELPVFREAKAWLDCYFSGQNPSSAPPLSPAGSAFQHRVWAILLSIPYGTVTTYGAIAKQIAAQTGKARMSAQAVGGAVGRNPISILIPCHRVIGADGSLTGYQGGVDKKVKLLTLEHMDIKNFTFPPENR